LARAGKVKSQTPKVEKQEKVGKAKVGRAKKRFQFNKRFAALKAGTDPKRIKANSQMQQQAIKEQKQAQAERIAAKKPAAPKAK
jgi:small subunit ribosomal protein S30e